MTWVNRFPSSSKPCRAIIAAALISFPGWSPIYSGPAEAPSASPGAQPPQRAVAARPEIRARALPGRSIQIKTKDGWTLAAQYQPAKPGLNTFLLLHRTGGRKEDWYYLARAMARKGIGVLALDLRGHGGSQNPPPGVGPHWRKFRMERGYKGYNEWNNMALDLEAVVGFLTTEGVGEASIALGGAEVGGSLAVRYAAVHGAVPLVFLLSPGMNYREIPTVNAIRKYAKRPILMVVGADDKNSSMATGVLVQAAQISAGSENVTLVTVEREHGTRMLVVNKGLITRILDWIEHPIRPPQLPETPGDAPGPIPGLPTDEELLEGLPSDPPASGSETPGEDGIRTLDP